MKYRADIDGLRALAVIPVILFHAGFSVFSGGFVGVDVFFVISGFLITSILLEDLEKGRFSLIDFYERRARRILPALFFVLFVTLIFAWLWLSHHQFKDFSKSLVAVGIFISNVFFWSQSGYFDTEAEEKPLLHTWSLSVEEQFYVIFPLFLLFMWRFGKSKLFWSLLFISIISLLLSEWGSRHYADANFYLLPTRAWELFAGCLAAIWIHRSNRPENKAMSWLGFSLILFAIFFFDEGVPFPSLYTLVPVIGSVLLLVFADKRALPIRFLSSRTCVFIGLISYSAYLWHQPLLVFLRLNTVDTPSSLSFSIVVVLSLFLAWFSWKYIEKPFRNKSTVGSNKIFALGTSGLAGFVLIGLFFIKWPNLIQSGGYNVLPAYASENKALQVESWSILRELSGDSRYKVEGNKFDNIDWFSSDNKGKERFLLVGNSHSKDLYNVMSNNQKIQKDVLLTRYGVQIRDLDPENDFWSAPNYKKADVVFFATRFTNKDINNLRFSVSKALSEGKMVYIVKRVFDMPVYHAKTWSLIDYTRYKLRGRDLSDIQVAEAINSEYGKSYQNFIEHKGQTKINRKLDEIAKDLKVTALSKMDYICGESRNDCRAVSETGQKYFYDYGHHTLEGAKFFGKRIDIESWLGMKLNYSESSNR